MIRRINCSFWRWKPDLHKSIIQTKLGIIQGLGFRWGWWYWTWHKGTNL